MSIIGYVRKRCGKHPMKEGYQMKRFTTMKNLTTGTTHYYMTDDEPRWDSEGRVDSRVRVVELDRESWEEIRMEHEIIEDLFSSGD